MGSMSVGEELLEARRRRRRGGDPRLSDKARKVLLRMTTGDLVNEFQDALDADLEDQALGDHDRSDDADGNAETSGA